MILTWTAPAANGLAISSYLITIQQSDGTFSADTANCDGSQAATLSSRLCTIPLSVLTALPYSLALGAAVNAKVVAYNAYGFSSTSAVGSGAIIQLVPSAPVTLSNNATLTLDSQIGIYWNDGASNGDSPVIDYSVFYMQSGASTFVQLASGVTSRSYLTTVALT